MSPPLLEVIVTSEQEAIEAVAGGADRLEVVRDLQVGGLTPSLREVGNIIERVHVPVRVMLRESESMEVGGAAEMERLRCFARELSRLPINGLVMGFLRDGNVDEEAIQLVLAEAPHAPVTFHRAFDEAQDIPGTLRWLSQHPSIDRVLTNGGSGTWDDRKRRVAEWGARLGFGKRVVFAVGKSPIERGRLQQLPPGCEVHVGRAARLPQTNEGTIDAAVIAALKTALLTSG